MKKSLVAFWLSFKFVFGVMAIYLGGAIIFLERVGENHDSYQKSTIEPLLQAYNRGPAKQFTFGANYPISGNDPVRVTNPYTGQPVLLLVSELNSSSKLSSTMAKLENSERVRLEEKYTLALLRAPMTPTTAGIRVVNYGSALLAFCIAIVSLASIIPKRDAVAKIENGN